MKSALCASHAALRFAISHFALKEGPLGDLDVRVYARGDEKLMMHSALPLALLAAVVLASGVQVAAGGDTPGRAAQVFGFSNVYGDGMVLQR